jgi:hypothetical protein
MRTFLCSCGNQLFFDNVACMRCKREVGWCPVCAAISDVTPDGEALVCANCSTRLIKCSNFAAYNVCNRFVKQPAPDGTGQTAAGRNGDGQVVGNQAAAPQSPPPLILCDSCCYNRTIPDLSVPGNQEKWYRLEAAKRRTLCDLRLVGFPYGNASQGIKPSLVFEFKSENLPDRVYRGMGGGQKVYTGHDNGVITINVQEADELFREKLRVDMGEAQRSLLGHFRHEFGHYIWDVLVKDQREEDCIAVFGDHRNPAYDAALKAYYQNGPQPNWLLNYVSAYATMHPWEDFAETFAVYLDMVSALDTAAHGKLIPEPDLSDLEGMVDAYQKLGIALNELNRNNGLSDFLPEVIAPPIRDKLRFIHSLAKSKKPVGTAAGQPQSAPSAS